MVLVRELTHIEGPQCCVMELQWGWGAGVTHFEKDERGLSTEHHAALRALLGTEQRTLFAIENSTWRFLRV